MEAYGLWLLLQSLGGYYGFVDAGLRVGVAQTISRHIASNQTKRIREHLATAIPVLASIAAAIVLFSMVVGTYLPSFVAISPDLAVGLLPIVVFQAFSVAVQLPFAPFGAILFGYQRLELDNAIAIGLRICSAIVIWIELHQGHGLLMMSIVAAISNTASGLLRWAVARHLCPDIRGITPRFILEELRALWHFGAWNSIILVSRQVIHLTDAVVIGILLTPKHVAYFGIAGSIIEYFNEILGSAARVLFPAMAKIQVNGELSAQRNLYKTATTALVALSVMMYTVGVCWYQQFVALWLGSSDETSRIMQMSFPVFVLLGLSVVLVSFQRTGMQMLLAGGRLKLLASLLLAEALLNLMISVIAGYIYGLVGVALGTLIPAAIFTVCFHFPQHCKVLQVPAIRNAREILVRPLLFAMAYVPAVCALKVYWTNPVHIYEFVFIGTGCMIISLIAATLTLIGNDDRLQLVGWIAKKRFA